MVALLAAVALAPWAHPARFRPLPGWTTRASGTFNSSYGPVGRTASPKESVAWMAKGVRYRDPRAADPPTATLSRFPPGGILVAWTFRQLRRPSSGESLKNRITTLEKASDVNP